MDFRRCPDASMRLGKLNCRTECTSDWNSKIFGNGLNNDLSKLQECNMPSTLAMMRITLFRITLLYQLFIFTASSGVFTSYGLNW